MFDSFNIDTLIKKTYFIHLFFPSINGKKKLKRKAGFCRMGHMSYLH